MIMVQTASRTDVHIRWMIRRDMQNVLAIEKASFDDPWTEEDVLVALRKRTMIPLVAELNETILGFMFYDLSKTHFEIVKFAVPPQWRRSGIGSNFIERLKDKLDLQRRSQILAYVRESNLPTHLFLRNQGFMATDIIEDPCEGETQYEFRFVIPII